MIEALSESASLTVASFYLRTKERPLARIGAAINVALAMLLCLTCCGRAGNYLSDKQAAHAQFISSWVSPDAKNTDLLYVANSLPPDDSMVNIYTYTGHKLVGQIGTFNNPVGLCVDRQGTIYVTNENPQQLVEFAHGSKTPARTIAIPGFPYGCAIDARTGDLAVTLWCDGPNGSCYGSGTVLVFRNAASPPVKLTDPDGGSMFYCTYDPEGNLFVDGSTSLHFLNFGEVQRGSSSISLLQMKLPGNPELAGGLQWFGNRLVAGYTNGKTIYSFKIHGLTGTLTHSYHLPGFSDNIGTNQFLLANGTLFAPELSSKSHRDGSVYVSDFPKSNDHRERFWNAMNEPHAVVLSPAYH